MLRIKELTKKVGLPRKYLENLVRLKKFPGPNLRGSRPSWYEFEVEQWMLGKWESRKWR